jgi:hypothetical protein
VVIKEVDYNNSMERDLSACVDCLRMRYPDPLPADPGSSYCRRCKRVYAKFRYHWMVKGKFPMDVATMILGMDEESANTYCEIHTNPTKGRPSGKSLGACPRCHEHRTVPEQTYCEPCLNSFKELMERHKEV